MKRASNPARIGSASDPAGSLPLLLKTLDACRQLGGIHPRTLARLEKRGLIRSVKLLRHKLYSAKDIQKLSEEGDEWKP